MRTRGQLAALIAAALSLLVLGGCSLANVLPATQPPGVTQQLMIRSLERALGQLDLSRLQGPGVAVDVYSMVGNQTNQTFVKEFCTAWLQPHSVRTVPSSPDLPHRHSRLPGSRGEPAHPRDRPLQVAAQSGTGRGADLRVRCEDGRGGGKISTLPFATRGAPVIV